MMCFKQWHTYGMLHAIQTYNIRLTNKMHRRRGVLHTPRIAPICNAVAVVCKRGSYGGVQGVCNTPQQLLQTQNRHLSSNDSKTMSDVGKTT